MKKLLFLVITLLSVSNVFAEANGFKRSNDFNSNWKFQLGEISEFFKPNYNDQNWRTITLPHDWSIEGKFDSTNSAESSGGYLPNGIGCYRKIFTMPKELNGKRISIKFDGVYMNSTVYINGIYLGNRPYGFSSFEYDLSPYIKFGNEENIIAVKVDHSLEPSCRWYTGSGINRNVYLLIKSQQHFKTNGIFFRTESLNSNFANLKIAFNIISNNYAESQVVTFQPLPDSIKRVVKHCKIISKLIDHEGKVQASSEIERSLSDFTTVTCNVKMHLKDPKLWSDISPYLYQLKNQIEIGGEIVDEEIFSVGIRQIKFNAQDGMFVNGEKKIIKGVCLHKDAGSFGTAVPKDVWRYRFTKLKAMGCNAIRTHGPLDPVFIETCDELGFYLMAEAFDEWNTTWQWGYSENTSGKRPYSYHLYFNQWAETDLKDMILRDRNHPAVFMYSVGNEVPDQRIPEGASKLAQLISWANEIDSTRPIIAACDWSPFANQNGFMDKMDIAGYNYIDRYFPNLYADEHKNYPNRILLGTETYPDLKNWLSVRDNHYVTGEFLWVGIDYLGEAIKWPRRGWEWGLIDLAGFEKPTYFIRQSYWAEQPMVHINVNLKKKESFKWQTFNVASHWNFNAEDVDTVFVYSNCEMVELFLNEKSLGRQKVDPDTYFATYIVHYEEGILKAEAISQSEKVAEHTLITAYQPDKLKLSIENEMMDLKSKELVYITIEIVDKYGTRCPNAMNNITVNVDGAGELIGLDSGNQFSHESYKIDNRNSYEGRILATIRPTKLGKINIQATANGLNSATKNIIVK